MLTPEETKIVEFGKANGKTQQEVVKALSKYRFSQPTPLTTTPPEQGVGERVGGVINTAGSNINDAISGTGEYQGQSSLARGFSAAATGANAVVGVGKELLPKPARSALDWAGEKIGQGFSAVTDKISETKLFKELGQLEAQGYINPQTTPEFYKVKDALSIGSSAGQISGDILLSDQVASGAQKAANTTGKVGAGMGEVASGVGAKISATTETAPSSIMNRVARLKPSDATMFKKLAGEDQGTYLTKTGNFGAPDKIITNEATKFAQSMADVDAELAKLKGTFKTGALDDALTGLVEKAKATSGENVKSPFLDQALSLQEKAKTTGLDMSEINTVKRLYEKNVKLGYNKLINGNQVEQATNIDNALRNWQFSQAKKLGFENIDALNKQTQISKFLVNKLGEQLVGKNGLNSISLSDWIVVSGGNPSSIATLLTKKLFSSKAVQAKIAEIMSKGKIKSGQIKPKISTPLPPQ